ncbi:MAG TPA: hypothetical protein VFH83_08460, partial [Spirochaetia bacterium]|nr:hypothetical protein [Spirochaetia bacterium]
TNVFTTAATATASSTSTQTTVTNSSTVWNGRMYWMLRWTPMSAVTLDLFGQTIMNALNFSIFGAGGGFNPNTFISSLGLSATFHLQ